ESGDGLRHLAQICQIEPAEIGRGEIADEDSRRGVHHWRGRGASGTLHWWNLSLSPSLSLSLSLRHLSLSLSLSGFYFVPATAGRSFWLERRKPSRAVSVDLIEVTPWPSSPSASTE